MNNKMIKLINYILLIIFFLLTIILYIFKGSSALITKISFVLFLLSIFSIIILNIKEIINLFKKSGTIIGIFQSVQFIIIIIILIVIYIISDSAPFKLDFTSASLYSLSDETKNILKNITNQLKITYFKPSQMSGPIVTYQENLLKTYKDRNKNITIEKVDPYHNRTMTVDYDIKEENVVVFEYEGNRVYVGLNKIFEIDQNTGNIIYKGEIAYTTAIKSLLASKKRIVYFLTGHNEIQIGDKGYYGYRQLMDMLIQENIKVNNLNLLLMPEIPNDCNLLVIGNPTKPLMSDELDKINNYINEGGSVLILLEYETHFLINDILKQMGLFFISNLIIEDEDYIPQLGRTVIVPKLLDSEITRPLLKNGLKVYLPTAVHITRLPEKERIDNSTYFITPFLMTSKNSYGEKSKEEISSKKVRKDKNDFSGPLYPGYIVKKLKPEIIRTTESEVTNIIESRMVVFGDSEFINNGNLFKYGNSDLFMNSIQYLLRRESEITIRPKSSEMKGYQLSSIQKRFLYIFAFSLSVLYLIPGIIIVILRRKKVKSKI